MSKIKKYNNSLREWKDYSSTHANGIYTEVPNLLHENENIISVETGLERLSNDIKTLKGNVAWLAKNGGGGSGSGGSGSSEVSASIQVNGKNSGEEVVLNDNGLNIVFTIKGSYSKSWNVSISLGVSRIYTGNISLNNPIINLKKSLISKYLINYRGNLTISASYVDDLNANYGSAIWNGTIIESSIYLYATASSASLQEINYSNISIDYSAGYLGDISDFNYQFIIKVSKNSEFINEYSESILIKDTLKKSTSIKISNLIPENKLEIGVYDLEISLKNIENSSIYSVINTTFTISSLNEIFISSKSLSEDINNPTEVALNGSLFISFIAYLQGYIVFDYIIKGFNQIITEGTGNFEKITEVVLSLVEKEWISENSIIPITIQVNAAGLEASKIFYIKTVVSDLSFLKIPNLNNLLYLFRANTKDNEISNLNYTNQEFEYNGGRQYKLEVTSSKIRENNLSVINRTQDGTPYLRISNGAAYSLDNWNFNGQNYNFREFFPNNNTYKDFTISLCYKADYHADDFRTILFCGTIDNTTGKISTGISIDVHDIYIDNKSVYKLTDNVINIIDITSETYEEIVKDPTSGLEITAIYYIIKVYVDGAVSFTEKLEASRFLNLGEKIYLGCLYHSYEGNDIYSQFCDCNIYNLQIYNKALSPYEIMINKANNLASTNYINNLPNYGLIDLELLYNFCLRDKEESDGIKSLLYNKITKNYNVNFLFSGDKLNQEALSSVAENIGIPIMYINVSSNSNWTFDNFIIQQSAGQITLLPASEVTIQYWDPGKTNLSILTLNRCDVSLQGTSTLEDVIKNLNITTPENTIFIPKETWLPERTYTLKADVVDSSHSNNAALGTFINEELGNYLPIDSKALDNVNNSNYVRTQQPTATLKHTIEGFPIFLILSFHVKKEEDVGITPLGIYSFNLGRDAIRNLGFTKINSITDLNDQLIEINLFPFAMENVKINTTDDSKANWIETKGTNSVSGLDLINSSVLPEELDTRSGDFWQNDINILNNTFEVRYPKDKYPSDYTNFKNFVLYIMKLPIESTSITDKAGNVLRSDISGSYNLYTCNTTGTSYNLTGKKQNISTDPNDYAGGDNVPFNIESYRKYFVISMLFGLIDNFGKNMAHKSWGGRQYYSGFYDLDSSLGGSNQGELNIPYYLWIKYLYNKSGEEDPELSYAAESYNKNDGAPNGVVAASHNKLWLSLDTSVNRQVLGSLVNSLYTQSWYNLRIKLNEITSNNGYDSFVDYFMDKYYINQTKNCGSLLFNYDYKLKYFLLFKDDSYKESKSLSKLHGRKIDYVRNWLEKRILFLDSLFYWRDTSQILNFKNDLNNRGTNTVRITPKIFPLMFNTSLIIYNSIGNQVTSYYFAKENEKLLIDSGQSNTDSIITWNLSNSSNLIEFGDSDNKLKNMNVVILSNQPNSQNINYAGYPSITTLDLSEVKTLGNFSLQSFTPTGTEGTYKRRPISEIRILDFSNTSGDLQFSLNLIETTSSGDTITRFLKLLEINIEGSTCISDLSIPDIPLQKLRVAGSSIRTFKLNNLAYLKEVDLEGCTRLLEISINKCSGYKNFTIQNLSNLTSCIITNCSLIENITIVNCGLLNEINIEACPNLKSIKINNCKSLINKLTIASCSTLELLSLESCLNLTNFIISNSNVLNLTTLNVSKTKLLYIRESGNYENQELLDLHNFTNLLNFDISSNETIKEILFANDQSKPINLTNTFTSCSNLERVYGNICLKRDSIFNGLRKFSILGNINKFNGKNIKDSKGIVLLPRLLADDNYFLEGNKVTNIVVDTLNLSNCFQMTNCTLFDIYYLLEKAGNKVTNISYIFRDLISDPFDWLNSPHRNMFEKNTNLTNLTGAFFMSNNTKNNIIRLYSPTKTNDNEFEDDGLFSPLMKNVDSINISSLFHNRRLVIDRNLFRISNKNKNISINQCSYFNVYLIVDDINSLSNTLPEIDENYIKQNYQSLGNLEEFFSLITSIGSTYSFMLSVSIINYDTLSKIPLTSITLGFNCSYGYGTLNILNLFRNKSNVSNITSSFRVDKKLKISEEITLFVDFKIDNNTLSGFNSLMYLGNVYSGYTNSSGYPTNSFRYSSFTGSGYNKYIETEMPYNLLKDCSNLVLFNGFFRNCQFKNQHEPVDLPGNLFQNNSKLEICSGTFNNIDFDYKLVGNSFLNCTKLKDVSYLFSYDTDSNALRNTGSIPSKLFYHGISNQVTKTIRGIKGNITSVTESDYTIYNIEKTDGTNYYCKIYNDGTIEWDPAEIEDYYDEETISYNIYNNNIINMEGCFSHNNIECYINTLPSIENNPDYMPFNCIFDNNLWRLITPDLDEKIIYWEYDGYNDPYNSEYKKLDKSDYLTYMYNILTKSTSGVNNYICSPDLLRYSKNNCNITYLFDNCGHNNLSSSYGSNSTRDFKTGLKGRIVPYLLLPLKNGLNINIDYMFRNCKLLSSYIKDNKTYLIPEDFFDYCPNILSMLYSFSGLVLNYNINLNVFNNKISSTKLLNISHIFFRTYYANTSPEYVAQISSIFNTFRNLNNTTRAFANSDKINSTDIRLTNIYILFSSIFPSDVYTKESYMYNNNFSETFAYFGNEGLVIHENPKTLPDNNTTNNYTMHI